MRRILAKGFCGTDGGAGAWEADLDALGVAAVKGVDVVEARLGVQALKVDVRRAAVAAHGPVTLLVRAVAALDPYQDSARGRGVEDGLRQQRGAWPHERLSADARAGGMQQQRLGPAHEQLWERRRQLQLASSAELGGAGGLQVLVTAGEGREQVASASPSWFVAHSRPLRLRPCASGEQSPHDVGQTSRSLRPGVQPPVSAAQIIALSCESWAISEVIWRSRFICSVVSRAWMSVSQSMGWTVVP
eukprot:COSAG04_NODE_512_length_13248_cov_51.630314_18_plen_246_part_00